MKVTIIDAITGEVSEETNIDERIEKADSFKPFVVLAAECTPRGIAYKIGYANGKTEVINKSTGEEEAVRLKEYIDTSENRVYGYSHTMRLDIPGIMGFGAGNVIINIDDVKSDMAAVVKNMFQNREYKEHGEMKKYPTVSPKVNINNSNVKMITASSSAFE